MRNQSFRVADVFSDHMVLQRDKEILIWGSGENGLEVCVELAGYVRSCIADGGRWIVRLPPFSTGGPYEMTIKSSTAELTLKDVFVGEVWLAGG